MVDSVIDRIGAQRTAVRLSPFGGLFDMGLYEDVEQTYLYVADQLSRRGLAYVHFMDQLSRGNPRQLSAKIPQSLSRNTGTRWRHDQRTGGEISG